MDGSQLIESFESLWFFTNVVSSSRTCHARDRTKEESPMKPFLQISLQNQEGSPEPDEFLSPKCSKCGDFGAEIEEHDGDEQIMIKTEAVEIPKPKKKEEIKRKRRQKRRRSKRKALGGLDLGFDHRSSSNYHKLNYGFDDGEEEETRGYGMFGSQVLQQYHQVKMPPLNDGMAMKEHLKSWAYAVACTVR